MSNVNPNLVADADRDGNYHSLANADRFNPAHTITVSHSDSIGDGNGNYFTNPYNIAYGNGNWYGNINTIADTDSYRHPLLEHNE
jgi:hypothetical protein